MSISVHKAAGKLGIELEGVVTIRQAHDAAVRIGEAFEGSSPIVVSAARLREIDTSILQLLCALRKTAPVLTFENPSEEFIAAVDRCGLRRELLAGFREVE